ELGEIEEIRIRREQRKRDGERIPKKAGPYHRPQFEEDMRKILLQNGDITPSEAGVELKPNKEGEVRRREFDSEKMKGEQNLSKPKGTPQQGRPDGSKDKQKRAPKQVNPIGGQSVSNIWLWANESQPKISEIVNPAFLKMKGLSAVRQLSHKDQDNLEKYKFGLLCNVRPFTEINENVIKEVSGQKINAEHLA